MRRPITEHPWKTPARDAGTVSPRDLDAERRGHVRVSLSARIRVSDGAIEARGRLVNVNHRGALIVPDAVFEPARDELEITISTETGSELTAAACVAWVRPTRADPAIGVRFKELSASCRQWVNEAVWIGTG